jgi:hypothetical protein
MDIDDHAKRVGYLHTNLTALESSLRYFLLKVDKQAFRIPQDGDVDAPLNWMTKWISLDKLIKRYNGELTGIEREKFSITQESVNLRDAIAHGRVHSPKLEFPWTLTKFGKQRSGRVLIDLNQQMTIEWLDNASKLVGQHKEKVDACSKARGFSIT